jgi:hypothetical protein
MKEILDDHMPKKTAAQTSAAAMYKHPTRFAPAPGAVLPLYATSALWSIAIASRELQSYKAIGFFPGRPDPKTR